MTRIGYKLMSEEHGPSQLVTNAIRAEELGFDFLGISDHYSPWITEQGHSPFAWSVLGAIAHATERVGLMTGVTCPFRRYHPAIVAQAAEKADGLIAVEANEDLVSSYRNAGGKGPLYAECGVCWATTPKKALDTLHRYYRWSVLGWSVLSELPRPKSFEEASESVEPKRLEQTPHGPDPETYLRAIDEFVDAGFDHILLTQAGPDQDGFFEFFERELRPELESRMQPEPAGARSR